MLCSKLRAHEGYHVSAKKALQGSETETGELLGGTEKNNILPDVGSVIFYLARPPNI